MQEHHKKSHKKEEKKSKADEKKEEKKGENEKKKKVAKEEEKKKKKHGEEKEKEKELDESAATAFPIVSHDRGLVDEGTDSNHELVPVGHRRQRTPDLPVTPKISSSSKPRRPAQRPDPLVRLLTANHDDVHPVEFIQRLENYPLNTTRESHLTYNDPRVVELLIPAQNHKESANLTWLDQSSRRSDDETPTTSIARAPFVPKLAKNSTSVGSNNQTTDLNTSRANTTILDIVDTLTGRQLNKTKIGTYELEEQQVSRNNPFMRLADYLLNPVAATNLAAGDNRSHGTTTTVRPHLTTQVPKMPHIEAQNFELVPKQSMITARDTKNPAAGPPLFGDHFETIAKAAINTPSNLFHVPPRGNPPELSVLPANEQATDETLQLLQLLQRASQLPSIEVNQPSLMGFGFNPHQQHQQASLVQSSLFPEPHASYHQQQQSLYNLPHGQLGKFGSGGSNTFVSSDHLIDYDQEALITPDAHNILVV